MPIQNPRRGEATVPAAGTVVVEMDLPQNQNGADKSHVWAIYERCRAHFRAARPV